MPRDAVGSPSLGPFKNLDTILGWSCKKRAAGPNNPMVVPSNLTLLWFQLCIVNVDLHFCLWYGTARYQGNEVSGDGVGYLSDTAEGSRKSLWKQRATFFLVSWRMFAVHGVNKTGVVFCVICVWCCVLSWSEVRLGNVWIWSESSQSFH